MKKDKPVELILLLYMPWLLSLAVEQSPMLSYMIAWLGSIFIFFLTLSGTLKQLPQDLSVAAQIMRPILLVQIIFAGYMSLTSIFYFLDVLGYVDFHKPGSFYLIDPNRLKLTAQCQRYYCLGHAAFVSGILSTMKYPIKQKYYVEESIIANLLFTVAIVALPVSLLFLMVNGLAQFYLQLSSLSFLAGTLALAFAIPQRKAFKTAICLTLYFSNFYRALVSGYKEPIILSVVILAIFLYPTYKRTVVFTATPIIIGMFLLLPTYNRVFRENSWSGDTNSDKATELALDAALNRDKDDSNWAFYTLRLSEIDMFTTFVGSTPSHIDFYGTKLIQQAITVLVPRVFWPGKPVTENMIMERVYDAGVVSRGSTVSAKPAFVVDAYLSGGVYGVFFFLFIYGVACQAISQYAEKIFGGYVLGTALIFSGMFQVFWRGLSLEFLVNSVFWSFVSMLIIFRIFRSFKILNKV